MIRWTAAAVLGLGALLSGRDARALPFQFLESNVYADVRTQADDNVNDPQGSDGDGRIALALTESLSMAGPYINPLPAEFAEADATATSILVAPTNSNRVRIAAKARGGAVGVDPLYAEAFAVAGGMLKIEPTPSPLAGLGDPVAIFINFTELSIDADPTVQVARSLVITDLTTGQTLYDSAISGLTGNLFVGAVVGDAIQIAYEVSVFASQSAPAGTGKQSGFAGLKAYVTVEPIPEPASLLLVGAGLAGLAARARRVRTATRRTTDA